MAISINVPIYQVFVAKGRFLGLLMVRLYAHGAHAIVVMTMRSKTRFYWWTMQMRIMLRLSKYTVWSDVQKRRQSSSSNRNLRYYRMWRQQDLSSSEGQEVHQFTEEHITHRWYEIILRLFYLLQWAGTCRGAAFMRVCNPAVIAQLMKSMSQQTSVVHKGSI